MSNRKVKINFTLVGKSFRNLKEIKDVSNLEIFYAVESQIVNQFGNRCLYISDKKQVIDGGQYPACYAAGWFISNDPIFDTKANGSELVVVAHGEDMQSAQTAMMKAVEKVNWDNLAKNI